MCFSKITLTWWQTASSKRYLYVFHWEELPILNTPKESSHPVARVNFLVMTLLLVSVMTIPAYGQFPDIPYLPDANDTLIAGGPSPPDLMAPASDIPPPTVQITSHQDGQQVPVGELTIGGISSDNKERDCRIYADVNDITPMRSVTAAVNSSGGNDFSKWTFTYSQSYHLIEPGANELTAKISCTTSSSSDPVSEWHTINITGVVPG